MMNLLPFIHSSGISNPMFSVRYAGDFGIGDIRGAYLFVDFLARSGQGLWKILPITETSILSENSPYDPISSFALDPIYIDVTILEDVDYSEYAPYVEQGRLQLHQADSVAYKSIRKFKDEVLRLAFRSFLDNEFDLRTERAKEFEDYCTQEHNWLDNYAFFKSLLICFSYTPLVQWPEEVKRKDKAVLAAYRQELAEEILFHKYVQWIFSIQWKDFMAYALARGVYILGDIPFYTGINSADVWSYPELFHVHPDLRPSAYGGSPPDIYSVDGQKWEVAVSKWAAMKQDNYDWWKRRVSHLSKLFNGLRLDHFRGFFSYWHIPADKESKDGQWIKGPGMELLFALVNIVESQPCHLCVENLGVITTDIEDGRYALGLPGYTLFYEAYPYIFQGQFDVRSNCQTTTHDSPPLVVWWKQLPDVEKELIITNVGPPMTEERRHAMDDELRWAILNYVYSLPFEMKLVPLQDILGTTERINTPATKKDNWVYRMDRNCENLLDDSELCSRLDGYARKYMLNGYERPLAEKTLPLLAKHVKRRFALGEFCIVWILTATEDPPTLLLSSIDDNKQIHISCMLISESNQGKIYKAVMKMGQKGLFTLSLLSHTDDALHIEVVETNRN